jgi:alpha-amylase/alpha-mannosidase (GH57 family)
MANTKKMTKKDYFEQIKRNYALTEDEVKFIDHEIELLEKKNAADKKPTAQQVANKSTQDAIYEGMESGKLYTITDLIKTIPECADMTNQRVSALVRQMVLDGKVERTEDKRKAYFKKVD